MFVSKCTSMGKKGKEKGRGKGGRKEEGRREGGRRKR